MPKSAGVSFVSEYHMDGNATTGGPIIAASFNKTETRLRLKTGGKDNISFSLHIRNQTSRLLSRVAHFPFEEFRCTGTNCYSFLAKSSFGVVRSCLKSHPQFMWIKDFNIVYCMSVRSSNLAHWLTQLSLSLAPAEYSLFEETCEGEIHWSSGTPISYH